MLKEKQNISYYLQMNKKKNVLRWISVPLVPIILVAVSESDRNTDTVGVAVIISIVVASIITFSLYASPDKATKILALFWLSVGISLLAIHGIPGIISLCITSTISEYQSFDYPDRYNQNGVYFSTITGVLAVVYSIAHLKKLW